MANVVLCSEYGKGTRFMARLADVAVEVVAQGHSARLVCADLHAAQSLKEFDKVSLFQAPMVLDRYRSADVPPASQWRNYSSVLLANGYDKQSNLTSLLRTWLHLIATLDADLVIADFAPTAVLAARLLNIPAVMIGTGYTLPLKKDPLPSFKPWKKKDLADGETDPDLLFEDQKVLRTVNASLATLGFEDIEFEQAKHLFSMADQWIMSLPEIDHYGGRKEGTYVVRWESTLNADYPHWPAGPNEKVFVYLDADSPHIEILFKQLEHLGHPVLAVIPKLSSDLVEKYSSALISIKTDAVNMRVVTQECRLFICHCGHGLIYELLMLGIPAILLPNNPANTLLAYRVAKRKLGFAGPAKASHLDIAKLIDLANTKDQVWANASRLSLKYQNRKSLHRLHDLIADKLSDESE